MLKFKSYAFLGMRKNADLKYMKQGVSCYFNILYVFFLMLALCEQGAFLDCFESGEGC